MVVGSISFHNWIYNNHGYGSLSHAQKMYYFKLDHEPEDEPGPKDHDLPPPLRSNDFRRRCSISGGNTGLLGVKGVYMV